MSINATLLGEFIAFLFVVMIIAMPPLCYYLGKKKTNNPILCAIVGFFLAFIPPFALVFVAVLALKSDLKPISANEHPLSD
ncbi:hypothetical protein AAEU32_11595 [Pseudoalteromonas sp. SSDWG2]|uniref:hypothetical protein n=1 Tax=Pseudoalteromonas sp. SSDWG2 TaxID=3139391 RepID=UPI003BA98B8B